MDGSVANGKRLIRVTAGNLRQNHIYISDHYDFFPSDCIGPSRKRRESGASSIEIVLDGLDRTVKTDISSDPRNGKPRRFFRGRSWVSQFFKRHRVRPGDTLVIERTGARQYRLSQSETVVQPTFAGMEASEVLSPEQVINVASVPHRSPFRYPGGKTWLVPYLRRWLRAMNDKPKQFVEPFAGGAIVGLTVLFEDLAETVTLVELDADVASVWQTILNGNGRRLASRISSFNVSLDSVRNVLRKQPESLLQRAFSTIVKNRMQRGGIIAPGASLMKNGENGKGLTSRWYPQTLSDRILAIACRRERIRFVHGDGMDIITENATRQGIAFFIDPPYTIAGKRLYSHSEIDHENLFRATSEIRGDFLMTYDNAKPIRELAIKFGLDTQEVAMKNTHHEIMGELLVGRNLDWLRKK